MDYTQFKLQQLKKHHACGGIKVIYKLTNLEVVQESKLLEGGAWQCTIAPINGHYLPRTISITGTVSAYAFKYDYTTGVIYIPSGEIYNDIIITAEGDISNNNIPAVLQVQKITADTNVNSTTYSDENFLKIDVYPSRGSTVSVTFDGVTKTVTGDLSTTNYDSIAKSVSFGTYGGQSDGTTATSGTLTISGAYESYCAGSYTSGSKGSKTNGGFITGISELGSIRYLSGIFNFDGTLTNSSLTFEKELDNIKGVVVECFNKNSSLDLIFEKMVKNINYSVTHTSDDAYIAKSSLYFNEIDFDWWAEGNRKYYNTSDSGTVFTYINGIENENITDINLTSNCKKIGDYAFYGFKDLANINLPNSIESIGKFAFAYCHALTSITIPSSVTSIEQGAFYGSHLFSITIPSSITSIKLETFGGCSNLTSITIPSSVTSIGDDAFENCESLTTINIPSGVTSIGNEAFRRCESLTTINIPSGVTSIGYYTFYGCYNLTSINIPSGVTSIGEHAFDNCNRLTSITIPSGVTSIGDYALNIGLNNEQKEIIFLSTSPPTITNTTFGSGTFYGTIKVPVGYGDVYKTKDDIWASYASYIVEG